MSVSSRELIESLHPYCKLVCVNLTKKLLENKDNLDSALLPDLKAQSESVFQNVEQQLIFLIYHDVRQQRKESRKI